MKLVWSPKSKERLIEILDYIAQDDPVAAFNLISEFENHANLLTMNPEIGRLISLGHFQNIRELVVHKNYSLIYSFDTTLVEILTVRHFKQSF